MQDPERDYVATGGSQTDKKLETLGSEALSRHPHGEILGYPSPVDDTPLDTGQYQL